MSNPVTMEELQKMLRMSAAMLVRDPVYLPIFERVEREIATRQNLEDAVQRAKAILRLDGATGV